MIFSKTWFYGSPSGAPPNRARPPMEPHRVRPWHGARTNWALRSGLGLAWLLGSRLDFGSDFGLDFGLIWLDFCWILMHMVLTAILIAALISIDVCFLGLPRTF